MPRSRAKLFPTPDDAETAFYDAFERADLAAMMAVWAATDEIVCIHPQGPRLTGFEAVRDSWAQIFSGGTTLRVRTTEARAFDGQALSVHTVIELVAPPGSETSVTSIFATNVYELTEGGWRMVVHHAAPAPSEANPRREEPASSSHTLH
ncbi:MAG: nuclear transport factor 2 family protein [Usitatibacter sp.]